jgi:hypothetical protein
LELAPEPDFLPPWLDASGELAIRAALAFDIPFSFSASYCFSFFTLGRLSGMTPSLLKSDQKDRATAESDVNPGVGSAPLRSGHMPGIVVVVILGIDPVLSCLDTGPHVSEYGPGDDDQPNEGYEQENDPTECDWHRSLLPEDSALVPPEFPGTRYRKPLCATH